MNQVHGTDPIEGSSLAISILEEFYNKGLLTIATTHYPEIKNYSLVNDGFENASSEFDIENLKPTYKLLIGIPGKSNAFAISKKLGLNNSIIERANNYINSDDFSIEDLLKSIYDNKIAIEKEKEETQKNLAQAENLRKFYEKKNDNLLSKETSIIENAKIEARNILLDAKEKASNAIQEINLAYKNSDISYIRNLNNTRNKLNDSIKETTTSSIKDEQQKNTIIDKNEIYIGMNVLIKNLNQIRYSNIFSK